MHGDKIQGCTVNATWRVRLWKMSRPRVKGCIRYNQKKHEALANEAQGTCASKACSTLAAIARRCATTEAGSDVHKPRYWRFFMGKLGDAKITMKELGLARTSAVIYLKRSGRCSRREARQGFHCMLTASAPPMQWSGTREQETATTARLLAFSTCFCESSDELFARSGVAPHLC